MDPFTESSRAIRLPYPPDVLPGSRDVETPYGSMHVFEEDPDQAEGGKTNTEDGGRRSPCRPVSNRERS